MALPYVIPPAGVSPASFFVPGVAFVSPEQPPALLADDIDPKTGELATLFTAPHPVHAAIQFAVRVRKGSGAAVQDIGHLYDRIKKKTDRTARELRDEAERLFKPFVDREDITVESIEEDLDQGFDGAAQRVKYRNRITGQTEDIRPR